MSNEPKQILTATLATSGPLSLVTFGLLPEFSLIRNGICAAEMGALISLTALALGLLATASLLFAHAADVERPLFGDFHLGIYFDNPAAVALVLVSFLLAVVARYSINYLADDPVQGRFTKFLCLGGTFTMSLAYGNAHFNFGHIS